MNRGPLKLGPETRVAIVGGGPAGSSFALYLLHYCEAQGFHPQITVFAERNVAASGPKGCKGCAGILSQVVLKKLQRVRIDPPSPKSSRPSIEQYLVHSPYISISMSNPEKGAEICQWSIAGAARAPAAWGADRFRRDGLHRKLKRGAPGLNNSG